MIQKLFILVLAFGFAIAANADSETASVRYEVPVKSLGLKKFASFEIKKVEEKETAFETEIRYTLPLELTGEPNELVFRGEYAKGSANTSLSGPNGTMMCSEGLTKVCNVQFKNLKIDEEARLTLLRALSHSSRELRGRLAVIRLFSGDPGGMLIYNRLK